MQMMYLYGGSDDYMAIQSGKYGKEVDKMIANSILRMVKSIGVADYEQSVKDYLASQILYEIFDMLRFEVGNNYDAYNMIYKMHGDLSKEAKKELYLKMQDKGFEH